MTAETEEDDHNSNGHRVNDVLGEPANLCATDPWFKSKINPWEVRECADQPQWLERRRNECLADLKSLKKLLDTIARAPKEERRARLNCALRQASGAYKQLARIDRLIGLIVPHAHVAEPLHRDLQDQLLRLDATLPVPTYYLFERTHVA